MIPIGSVVRHKTKNIEMVVNAIVTEDSYDLIKPANKGDIECAWWDGSFHYETYSPLEVELIEKCNNEEFAIGDTVKLKSGSDIFVVVGFEDNDLLFNQCNSSHSAHLFKKV